MAIISLSSPGTASDHGDNHKQKRAIAPRAWGVATPLDGEYVAAEARLNHVLNLCSGLKARWQIGRTLF